MAGFSRREFLKAVSLAGTATAVGCSPESAQKLIPYIIPPEDIIPGKATWYATTCRECPAGCGILAKNRDGRVIKVEGNPLHPVNQGRLCPRGQASVQGVYNPDRYRGPLRKTAQGKFEPVSWEIAERVLEEKISELDKKGKGKNIVFLTDLITGTLRSLTQKWLRELGSEGPVMYEPLAYEPLRQANKIVFGLDAIPTYHLDRADFLLSFGANFLETWISNVQFAREFSAFHAPRDGGKGFFVYVGPRLSMTAANADHWLAAPPEGQSLVAWGLIRLLLQNNLFSSLSAEQKAALQSKVADFSPQIIESRTGVSQQILSMVAQKFIQAKNPLVLAEGLSMVDPHAMETAIAANLLCAASRGTTEAIDWDD
ncbi:MAG: molybdopterin-dependent oxidoreductase, partial [Deltaproteobacteria bacterium]|nr:molybdopterin-dependent oxidoreductase [Deltaproteobacteria bacterium]